MSFYAERLNQIKSFLKRGEGSEEAIDRAAFLSLMEKLSPSRSSQFTCKCIPAFFDFLAFFAFERRKDGKIICT